MNSILSIIRSSLDGDAIAQIGDSLGEGIGNLWDEVKPLLGAVI